LADSQVAITAGSGINIDTRTEASNGQHRQVVVLGDPSVNAGVAPVDVTNGLSVTLTTAIPAGSAAIGKLAANSGVIIGDVNIAASQTLATVTNVATIGTSVTPGTSAAHLGKAEDNAHVSGDTGVAIFGVRSDTTPSSTSGTAGDYSLPNLDANGRLYTNTVLYTSAGAVLTPDTQGQQDTALGTITSVTGSMAFGRASTGAPSAVSADDDAVLPWFTREGKIVTTTAPHTAGGLTTFMASGSDGSSILVATAQAIKASAGQLYGYYAYNPEAAVTFVHFYNTASGSVTVGTTNPQMTIALPAGAAANMTFPFGVVFSNAGWSCAATTTAGGNTAPSTGVSLVVWYA
jgi:hypothetical protein